MRRTNDSICCSFVFFLVAAAVLWAAVNVHCQTAPDHWELGIFSPAGYSAGPTITGNPLTLTVYLPSNVHCRLPKAFSADVVYANVVDGPTDNIPNPSVIAFNDPVDPNLECRADVTTPVLALPQGTGFRAAMRAVTADGTKSAWSNLSNSFRRAPRGLPCTMPSGAAGIQTNVTPDINGVQKQVSICVQM